MSSTNPADTPPATPSPQVPPADAPRASILVVDDTPDNRDLLSRRVAQMGHSVTLAEDGRQAMELLRSGDASRDGRSFDLVLLDIMMPVMSGFEVLEQLKADPVLRHVPVIVISALGEVDSVVRCVTLGAEDYLFKPFNTVLLKARVSASLEKKWLRDREQEAAGRLREEQERSQRLLLSIFPAPIAERLKADLVCKTRTGAAGSAGGTIADSYPQATVLFAKLSNFTQLSAHKGPAEVVDLLDAFFSEFDRRAERLGVEKVKTIGDTYMAVGGVPVPRPDHAEATADLALSMQEAAVRLNTDLREPLSLRIGIDTGPVVAGVIGTTKFAYDLWGRTVDTASQMEAFGVPGGIQVTAAVRDRLQGKYLLEDRGAYYVEGAGEIETYFLTGRRPTN